jgi:hypothetical protein
LHVHIILILNRVNSQGKIQLHVTYIKMVKYANNTIMFGFVKKYIYQFFRVGNVWSHFHLRIDINNYQDNM